MDHIQKVDAEEIKLRIYNLHIQVICRTLFNCNCCPVNNLSYHDLG